MKHISILIPALAMLALPAARAAEPNTLTSEEQKDGFKLIFDGKTTDGWRNYNKDSISDQWKVVDGALTLTGKGGGDIITTEKFENFEFRFEFKIAPDGNSGVMWHVAEIDGPSYLTGPEYQILDSKSETGYEEARKKGNVSGAFYDLVPAKPELFTAANEWNDGRIIINGPKIMLYLNGEKTADVDTTTDEWKKLLAKSKFADWEHFNSKSKGHICLQGYGDVVSFRTMRIKEL